MRHLTHFVLIGACVALGAPGLPLPSAHARQQNPGAADRLSDADLEELLAPIALYPDPLLANVLAASCYPDELAAAAKGGSSADWEPSVQAIAKVPDAMKMLTDYPDWTKALGEAFILQSPDVMRAVQNLRARAYANGALQTSEQMVVQQQGDTIIIEPAQPEIIYVPTYSPSVVYVDHHDDAFAAGVIGFGLGITAGLIIGNNMDCDWHGGGCCYGCGWGHGHGDVDVDINVNNNTINNIKNNGNKWKPNNTKINNDLKSGRATAMNNYKGVGTNSASNARVPGRTAGSTPIATRKAPSASQAAASHNRAVPTRTPAKPTAQPMNRPDTMNRPAAPKAKPSIPPASQRPPAARPTGGGDRAGGGGAPQGQRPSAYSGGSQRQSAQRGASSRGSSGGGSRGGGGGSRGGGGGGRGGGGGGRR